MARTNSRFCFFWVPHPAADSTGWWTGMQKACAASAGAAVGRSFRAGSGSHVAWLRRGKGEGKGGDARPLSRLRVPLAGISVDQPWLSSWPRRRAQSASARPGRNLEASHAGTAKLDLCRSLSSRASDLDDLFADPRPSVTYKLRIITGDLRGAGTSEEIMIQVHCASRPLLRMYARAWPSSYPAAA